MATPFPFASALVTGASSGIGAAMVHRLGEAGVSQVIVARRRDRLESLAEAYANVEVLRADLTTAKGVGAVVERVTDPSRPIELVVNNAGFGTSGPFHTLDADRLANEITLNCIALTRISRAALCEMVERGSGYLLNVSSVASFQPVPNLAVYAATKAYIRSLTESLHEEVRGTGVHVTALCPGLTRTEFQAISSSGEYAGRYPSFAWMSADDVAATGLDDVAKGRAVSVPGMLYKGLVTASSMTPRGMVRRVVGFIQRA
ncbi:MAG TPA: SDR family oxidoreductase [Ilumatobacteraceae bacterium]|jgi:hypothetical protein